LNYEFSIPNSSYIAGVKEAIKINLKKQLYTIKQRQRKPKVPPQIMATWRACTLLKSWSTDDEPNKTL